MALITCPQCGQSVSDSAMTCIHCGCKLKKEPENFYTLPPSKQLTLQREYSATGGVFPQDFNIEHRTYSKKLKLYILQSNKTEKNLYYVRLVLSTLLTVVATVCCGKFIINYGDSYFYCQFWETENNFLTTFSSYIPLIICGAAVFGKCIIDFSNNTYNKMQKWCKDNSLPYDFNMK